MNNQEPVKLKLAMHCAECGERLVFVQEPGTAKVYVYPCKKCEKQHAEDA